MSAESIFRIAFWILCGGLLVMQVYFAAPVQRAGERVRVDRGAIEREGWGYIVVRIIGSLALIVFLALYAINPPWLSVLSLPFTDWLRWVGILLGLGSFILYAWAQDVLGKEWSPHLQMRQEHHMVTSIVVFARRIPKEELMLIEVFGAQYAEYIRRTGGLLPKV
jgi:protein-S-isoprenylcysteine O-methyltransferase Ste14